MKYFISYIILSIFSCAAIAQTETYLDAGAHDDDEYYEYYYAEEDPNLIKDPLENMNRRIFAFNSVIDKFILRPTAIGYRKFVPAPGKYAISNILDNLGEPITFLNSVLQHDVSYSFITLGRFTINSTIGMGGLIKIADNNRREDFSRTLAFYGVPTGPFLVLPFIGQSDVRDSFGLVADILSDPLYYGLSDSRNLMIGAISGIEMRESILDITDEIEANSIDVYAKYRSLYSQRSKSFVVNE